MNLTQKIFGLIYDAFDRDAAAFLAMRIRTITGRLTWTVSDGILTTTPVLSPAKALTVDLSAYNLSALANFISSQSGYVVTDLCSPDLGQLSALVILDASGDSGTSNGDHLYAYSNPNWAYLEAMSSELEAASAQIGKLAPEMATTTADGEWLDLLGSFYHVPRLSGEMDAQYGPRIPAEVLLPKSNNIALENLISSAIGQAATVDNVVVFGSPTPAYDGSYTHDGSRHYNSTAKPVYGLFDVSVGYDVLGALNPTGFAAFVRGLVNRIRAAGTFMRALVLSESQITDTIALPSDTFATLVASPTFADTTTAPTDTALAINLNLALVDAATAPIENTDTLTVTYGVKYVGARHFDGAVIHAGTLSVFESMAGTVTGHS